MYRIVEDDNPPIPEGCSLELTDFLKQCFQKDPKKRPSAEELCDHDWLRKYWVGSQVSMEPCISIEMPDLLG
jgi:serine/threonine protein kinase